MSITTFRPRLTRLMLSGIAVPAKSDKDISVSIRPIAEATSFRRAVNGDLIRTSRPSFDKMSLAITGSDMYPAALVGVRPGRYVECVPPDHYPVAPGQTYNRAAIDVFGVTAAGERVEGSYPLSHSPLPLSASPDSARIADLRSPWIPQFPAGSGVVAVFLRPVYCCLVRGWGTDQDERTAAASWSLELEEV